MKIYSNGATFEFQRAVELPKPLAFPTIEDALTWLKHLWSQDSAIIARLRTYL
jgi:hypothetical protein